MARRWNREQSAVDPSLPSLPPEIRFEPLGCPPKAVDLANTREKQTGERRYEPVDVVLSRLKRKRSFSPEFLESCALHPDERVPIALLESGRLSGHAAEMKSVLFRIAPRAVRDARARGEVWTPLLDSLSSAIGHEAALTRPLLVREEFAEKHHLERTVRPLAEAAPGSESAPAGGSANEIEHADSPHRGDHDPCRPRVDGGDPGNPPAGNGRFCEERPPGSRAAVDLA